jgi:hypothetical protein
MLLKQTTETAMEGPPHGARLQRCLLSTHNPINQLLPLPLRTPQKKQLPPHLRNTEVQRKEHCACLLQDQAASLVSCRQAASQLSTRATATSSGILGPCPSLVHRLVAKLFFMLGVCHG